MLLPQLHPTLYATIQTLPEEATLYDSQNEGHFLRFQSGKGWSINHQHIGNSQKEEEYPPIAQELFRNGMGDFPTRDLQKTTIRQINAFFTSRPSNHSLHDLKDKTPLFFDDNPKNRYFYLGPSNSTLIVDEYGDVFPSIRCFFDQERLQYADSEDLTDKLAKPHVTQKKVDRIVNEYINKRPQNKYDDLRMIDLMENSIRLAYDQNPVLQSNLLDTGERRLIYRVPTHKAPLDPHEFAQDRQGSDRGSLFGQDKDGVGRNWVGTILETVRNELRERAGIDAN